MLGFHKHLSHICRLGTNMCLFFSHKLLSFVDIEPATPLLYEFSVTTYITQIFM